jgi:RHS repeat-associated protein
VDYTYVNNQLTSITDNGATSKYFYDSLGRLDCVTTGSGTAADCKVGSTPSINLKTDYSFDALDRLEGYRTFNTGSNTSTENTYDALDRLNHEEETHGTSSRKTIMNYQGLSDLVTKETHRNPSTDALIKSKSYSYDSYGHRISMTDTLASGSAQTYTYAYDVHGSVSMLLDSTSEAKAAYGYTAYGDADAGLTKEGGLTASQSQSDPFNAYRYSARRLDSGSGSIDMGARRFGPDTSRFLQPDYFNGAVDDLNLSIDPLTQNRYALAGGNPISFVEWDGHMPVNADGGTNRSAVRNMSSGMEPGSKPNEFAEAEKVGMRQVGRSQRRILSASRRSRISPAEQRRNQDVALDVMGAFFDPIDAVRCGVDSLHGEFGNATLNCIAMIPVMGQGIKGALKYGDEVLGVAEEIAKLGDEARVYHRVESTTQTTDIARLQEETGEIWGRAPRGSDIPKVQAYRGPLPEGRRGIEFITDVAPDPGGVPFLPTWSGPRAGVRVEDGFAKICAVITRNTQC